VFFPEGAKHFIGVFPQKLYREAVPPKTPSDAHGARINDHTFSVISKRLIPFRKKISTQLHLATLLAGDNFINKIWQRIPLVPYIQLWQVQQPAVFSGDDKMIALLVSKKFLALLKC